MGKVNVYNSGSFSEESQTGESELKIGLFFDGTANNLYNTDARKYVIYKDKKGLSEREKKEKERIEKEYPEKKDSEHKYTRNELKTAYDNYKDNTSYENDLTNIAKIYLKSNRKKYAIYIEGVGTGDLLEDSDLPGISHADGEKGLLKKIRKGSEELIKVIKEHYKETKNKNLILTLDVFGFSRGATAARHFLYQVSNNKHLEVKVSWIGDTTFEIVDESYLQMALKEAGLNKLVKKINIRFVGLYDTVASFNPVRYNIDTDFEKYVHLLHLNEIGDPMLAIHFTALDEIREYFSLTRLSHSKAIEKNLPGAHSDVGGSYDCDGVNLYEKVILGQNLTHFKDLKNLKQEMIKEGWYSEGELELKDFTYPAQNELIGTRIVMGEYSYLPLLWMSKYASFLIEKKKIDFPNIKKIYNIETEEGNVLKEVKKHLKKHLKNTYNIESEDTLKKVKTYLESTTFKELTQMEDGIKNIFELKTFIQKDSKVKEDWTFKSGKEQNLLKNLRHRYLHQSASYENAGGENFKYPFVEPNKPAEDRKRIEIPG